ncbi:MAG: exodeoxyribonuclease III [Desulfomonilaceae bacterium]
MSKVIRILSWNVNGIRAIHKKGFLDWLAKERPDILCIQETKASIEQLSEDLLAPNGYTSYWSSAVRKGYSGVSIYTKTAAIDVKNSMGIPEFDHEGRFLRVDFDEFVLMNVYFPNGKMGSERLKFKLDFYDAFLDYIERLREQKLSVIFLGDVNTAHQEIDLARPKENSKVSGFLPVERQWIDTTVAKGYLDTFRKFNGDLVQYSWWDMKSGARNRNIGWRIDYVFVSADLEKRIRRAFILTDVQGSDHCPVGIDLETQMGF